MIIHKVLGFPSRNDRSFFSQNLHPDLGRGGIMELVHGQQLTSALLGLKNQLVFQTGTNRKKPRLVHKDAHSINHKDYNLLTCKLSKKNLIDFSGSLMVSTPLVDPIIRHWSSGSRFGYRALSKKNCHLLPCSASS